jgi:hypothetical protein
LNRRIAATSRADFDRHRLRRHLRDCLDDFGHREPAAIAKACLFKPNPISAVTPLWPFSNSDGVTRKTPSHFAAAVTERSRDFRQ